MGLRQNDYILSSLKNPIHGLVKKCSTSPGMSWHLLIVTCELMIQ